jgi:hypothetical protein
MTRYLSHPQALKQAAICYQTTVWHPAQGEMVVNIAMHCDSTLQAIPRDSKTVRQRHRWTTRADAVLDFAGGAIALCTPSPHF